MGETSSEHDAELATFLDIARQEIISWVYSYSINHAAVTQVPESLEPTQIMAVVAGYSQRGNEGQMSGTENGITRKWKYADMLSYIRNNTIPYGGFGGVSE
jgi:hypothetical protein